MHGLPTDDGDDATGVAQPAGGRGVRGWLSGLFSFFQYADNSANSTKKLPVLPAVANAADPAWTEGRQVPLSVDLDGNVRVAVSGTSSLVIGKVDQGAPNAGGALAWPVTVQSGVERIGYIERGHIYLTGSVSAVYTLDKAQLDIAGDLDSRMAYAPQARDPVSDLVLDAKWDAGANQRSWTLLQDVTGKLLFLWSADGVNANAALSTAVVPFSDNVLSLTRVTLDVNNGASGNTVTFYTKDSTPDRAYRDCLDDSGWTQLGDPVVQAGVTSVFNSTASLSLGLLSGGGGDFIGRIYAYVLKNGIGSVGVVVAAPNFGDRSKWSENVTSASDDFGNTWLLLSSSVRGFPTHVQDKFKTTEYTTDQNGANGVLTFTLANGPADFVIVDVDNTSGSDSTVYRARATVDGSAPTAILGCVCRSGGPTYLPFPSIGSDVKVYAPTGTVVAVNVGRY